MLVPILLWVAALASAAVAIWQGPRPIDRSFLIDRLLRYLFVFPLGLLGLWAFLGHVFSPSSRPRRLAGRRARFNMRSASPISASRLPRCMLRSEVTRDGWRWGLPQRASSSEPALGIPGT